MIRTNNIDISPSIDTRHGKAVRNVFECDVSAQLNAVLSLFF